MEKTIFKNQLFFYMLVSYLIIMICWNSYTVISGNLIGIIPIVVQLTVLYLIIDKHKYAKIGIKIWSILLIAGPSLSIFGGLLKMLADVDFVINKLIQNILILTIGIFIFYFNEKTLEVSKPVKID